jgi:hypothetical protein
MSSYYKQEFENYIEHLCREHVDILHGSNGIVAFSKLRSETEVTELVNNAGENIVIIGRFNGRAVGEKDEQAYRQSAVIRFACYAKNNGVDSPTAGIDDAIAKAEMIMYQFIARMRKDYKDDDCGALQHVELQNLNWNEIDERIYLQNHYGWDLFINYKNYFPGFDAAKWNIGDPYAIQVGTETTTARTLTLAMRFQVGETDAPMNDGDTVLTSPLFGNKKVMVIVSSLVLPVDDGSGAIAFTDERRVEKTDASHSINFIGAVVHDEIIEIYTYTQ